MAIIEAKKSKMSQVEREAQEAAEVHVNEVKL